jgi:hypothetical protein
MQACSVDRPPRCAIVSALAFACALAGPARPQAGETELVSLGMHDAAAGP